MLEVWETRSSGEKSLTGFEQKKYSVYFIQEMHCTENNKNDWRAECTGDDSSKKGCFGRKTNLFRES